MFHQELLRCWSLLAGWSSVIALGFYSIAWYQETLENVKYLYYAGSVQIKSQHRVVVLCRAHLRAVVTPQNFRNEWSTEGTMNQWPQHPFKHPDEFPISPHLPAVCAFQITLLSSRQG